MNRDAKLSEISREMVKINEELDQLNKRKHELYDMKSRLIESWDKIATISKDDLENED